MKMQHPPQGGPAAAGAGQGALLCLTLLRGDARTSVHVHACAWVCRHMRVCTRCAEQKQAETDLQLSRVVVSQEKCPSSALPGGMQAWELPPLPHHPFLAHGWYLPLQEFTWVAAPGWGALCRSVPWGSHEPPTAQGSSPSGLQGPWGHPCPPFSARQLPWGEGGTMYGTAGLGGASVQSPGGMGTPFPGCQGRVHSCHSPEVDAPKGLHPCTTQSTPCPPPPCRGQHPPPSRPGPLCSPPQPAPMTDAWQSPGTTQQVFKNIN